MAKQVDIVFTIQRRDGPVAFGTLEWSAQGLSAEALSGSRKKGAAIPVRRGLVLANRFKDKGTEPAFGDSLVGKEGHSWVQPVKINGVEREFAIHPIGEKTAEADAAIGLLLEDASDWRTAFSSLTADAVLQVREENPNGPGAENRSLPTLGLGLLLLGCLCFGFYIFHEIFSSEKGLEQAGFVRGWITLLICFATIVFGSAIVTTGLRLHNSVEGFRYSREVFGSFTAILATIVGFYFGSEVRKENEEKVSQAGVRQALTAAADKVEAAGAKLEAAGAGSAAAADILEAPLINVAGGTVRVFVRGGKPPYKLVISTTGTGKDHELTSPGGYAVLSLENSLAPGEKVNVKVSDAGNSESQGVFLVPDAATPAAPSRQAPAAPSQEAPASTSQEAPAATSPEAPAATSQQAPAATSQGAPAATSLEPEYSDEF